MSLPIWMFWEGARPAYIDLCLESVRRHHPDVRLLDRAGFDALWTDDRNLPIDRLALNHLSDYVRAWLLSRHGGLYIDADCIVIRDLSPLLAAAEQRGFVGYREPQGYMSCNFMASSPGGAVIGDHYQRVADRLRRPGPLEWLDLASMPMNAAMARHGDGALILATESVMPLAWNESQWLAVQRDDAEHEQHFRDDGWTYMLSNNTIRSDRRTRHLAYLPREPLLEHASFLGFLLRRALGLPARNAGLAEVPTAPHLGGHEELTQFDEGAFDCLVEHFGAKSFLDIGCGPGGMAAYAMARGLAARGVDGDPRCARGSNFIVEHDYSAGPLELGAFDLGWAVEFVEHVDEQYVPNFMATLAGCRHVFITAAIPGQPGHHHVNCQWGDYWIARFAEAGFRHDEEATAKVRRHSTMESRFTEQTGLVFSRSG